VALGGSANCHEAVLSGRLARRTADMMRIAIVAALLAVGLPAAPSFAQTKDAKMETCRFGADSQNLQGVERKKFIDRCMSDKNDPRGPGAGTAAGAPKP
jgi:hypothetical protein